MKKAKKGILYIGVVLSLCFIILFVFIHTQYRHELAQPVFNRSNILPDSEIMEHLISLNTRFAKGGLDYLTFTPYMMTRQSSDYERYCVVFIGQTEYGKLTISLLAYSGELVGLLFFPQKDKDWVKKETFFNENGFPDWFNVLIENIPPGLEKVKKIKRSKNTSYSWSRKVNEYPIQNENLMGSEIIIDTDHKNRITWMSKEWLPISEENFEPVSKLYAELLAEKIKWELVLKGRICPWPKFYYTKESIRLLYVTPNSLFIPETDKDKEKFIAYQKRLAWVIEYKKVGRFPSVKKEMTTRAIKLLIYIDAETGKCIGGSIWG